MTDDIKHIIESLLFVSKEPLSPERIRAVLDLKDTAAIRASLITLAEEYETRKGGFFLREVAGGFQLRSRPEYKEWIKRLVRSSAPKMSKPALETLAIIAYKQPIIRADIEHIRGVDSGAILRMLLERRLIKVLGRKEIPGRPMIYATTKQFLEIFDLKDLKDLPSPQEFEELGKTVSEEFPAISTDMRQNSIPDHENPSSDNHNKGEHHGSIAIPIPDSSEISG